MKSKLILAGALVLALGLSVAAVKMYMHKKSVSDTKIGNLGSSAQGLYSNADGVVSEKSQSTSSPLASPSIVNSEGVITNENSSEQKTLSLHEIQTEYDSLSFGELQTKQKEIKMVIQNKGLIEKANHGRLTANESNDLRMYMRRQGVLSVLMAKAQLRNVQ